jgi:hypothetical protein
VIIAVRQIFVAAVLVAECFGLLIVLVGDAAAHFTHIPVEPWNSSTAFSVVIFPCAPGRPCFARSAGCARRQVARPT